MIITGKYKWLDTLTMPETQIEQIINFTSNNITYIGIRATTDTMYYVKEDNIETEVYNIASKWVTEDIKNQIISIINSQDVDETFLTWFSANTSVYIETLSYDLSTSTKWTDILEGEHIVQIVAKANNYRDSEKSISVTFTKDTTLKPSNTLYPNLTLLPKA